MKSTSTSFYELWSLTFTVALAVAWLLDDWWLSQKLIQCFFLGIFAAIARASLVDVKNLVYAKTLFWLGLVYTILLNPTLGTPEWIGGIGETSKSKALFLVMLFSFSVMVGSRLRASKDPGESLSRYVPDVGRGMLLAVILALFFAELARRLYFVGWSVDELLADILKARSGEVRFGRGQFGDGRVFLEPLSIAANWIPVLSAVYWAKEKHFLLRVVVMVPTAFVLISSFFGGSRGALATPIAAFLAYRILTSPSPLGKKYVLAGVAIAFVLAPLMDMMVTYRNVGWSSDVRFETFLKNPLSAERDANFDALANVVEKVPAVEPYKNPMELYYFMAIAPIPRVMWPEKPYMSQEYLGSARAYYASISIVGDLYFYGGPLHVVLGGLGFGIALGFLCVLFNSAKHRPNIALLYLMSCIGMVWCLRAMWSLITALVIMVSVFGLLSVAAFVQDKLFAQSRRPLGMREL